VTLDVHAQLPPDADASVSSGDDAPVAEPGAVEDAGVSEPTADASIEDTETVEATGAEDAPPATDAPEDDDGWGQDADGVGFAEATAAETAPEIADGELSAPRPLSASGFLRSDVGFWSERLKSRPIAQLRRSFDGTVYYREGVLRLQLGLHAEADGAYLIDRSEFDQATLDAYQSQVYLRESHAALSFDALDITFGKQIVAWGEGDVISPLDVVNPRDMREPGLADLDDLRLPVLSTRVGVFAGYHRFEAMLIHEAYFGLLSPPRGPFSPLPAVIDASGGLPEGSLEGAVFDSLELSYRHTPERYSLDAQQLLARWVYKGPGLDTALYAGSVRDQQGVLVGGRVTEVLTFDLDDPLGARLENRLAIEQRHPRYTMVGHSGAVPWSDFLFKWELYGNLARSFNVRADPADNLLFGVDVEKRSAVGGMLSATYAGITDTRIFVEFGKAWLVSGAGDVLFPFEAPNLAVRAHHEQLAGDLTFDAAWTAMGWQAEYGWLGRAEVGYKFYEAMRVAVGYITYQPGSELSFLSAFGRHDRLFFKYRWDFSVS